VRKTEQSSKRNKKRKVIPANQRRREILQAAAQVFSENGYHETKVSDIAARAGIGHGTVYRFFPSKRALARDVIGGLGATGFIESLKESSVENLPPDEFLKIVGKRYFGNLRNRLPVIRFAISEGVKSKEFGRQYYESPLHRLFSHLAGFVAEFQKRGVFRQADSFILGHIFYSICGERKRSRLIWTK
jgi:AcrR family transcriptional regulator